MALFRIIVGLAICFQVGCVVAADTVRIVFIGGLSGTFALQGEEQLKVFHVAADMTNSRGGVLGGRKIEIVPFDNKANPPDSLIVLKQAIDQDIG